ncbi:hypothetical protein B0H15DRAFT_763882, partial [Mycena belliarum]
PPPTSASVTSTSATATTTSTSASATVSDTAGQTSTTSPASSLPPTTTATTAQSVTTSAPPSLSLSRSISTDADGETVTLDVTITSQQAASSTSSSLPSPSKSSTSDDSGGLSTGGIIGLAVAGGVTVICVIAFFIWKFTRKQGGDFDDSENIKWPELNAHSGGESHAMPVTSTGRAGFGEEHSRAPSVAPTFASSADFHSEDPYAVPPLPHLNPGQPYRDDPGAGAYYDPYRGPVPQTFNEAAGPPPQEWGQSEAIAMTQMGRASPAPMMYDPGRASPGPQMGYGGGGRTPSPGPQVAYGAPRTASPGPQAAYGAPRTMSPGPQAAYGAG